MPRPLYGRGELLSDFKQKLTARRNCRVLLSGPRGSGKSEFLKGLQHYIRQSNSQFVSLHYQIGSSNDKVEHALSELTIQLLQQVDVPGSRLTDFRAALNLLKRNRTFSLGTAALLDIVSATAPYVKETAKSVFQTVQEAIEATSPGATAERIAKAGKDDILSGFIWLIEALAQNGVSGCILLDGIEVGSQAMQSLVDALVSNLPSEWSICITTNDETSEGQATLREFEPKILYIGGERCRLEPLDLQALEAWTQDIRGYLPDVDELRQALEDCGGRPLFLRAWVEGSIADTKLIMHNRLGAYYTQRIDELSEDSRWLLTRLAILPAGSIFPFEFCDYLLDSKMPNNTVEHTLQLISELRKKYFLEPLSIPPNSYRFVHEVTQYHIFHNLPTMAIEEAASDTLAVFNSYYGITVEDLRHLYAQIVLAGHANNLEIVAEKALPVASQLIASGSYAPALEVYELCLTNADSAEAAELSVQALIGIARVLLDTGYYQDSLQKLETISTDKLDTPTQCQVALLRGEAYMRLNQYQQAITELKAAYDGYQSSRDSIGQIEAAKNVITIRRDIGEYDTAVQQSRLVVQRANESGAPPKLMASCYRALARSLALAKESEEAVIAAQTSLDIALKEHLIRDEGNSYLAFGEAYRHGSRFNEAISYYSKAIDIAKKIANRDSFLWSALGLADALLLTGQYSDAQRILESVGEITRDAANRYPLEHLHWELSQKSLEYINGDTTDAELLAAAKQYDALHIVWPHSYVQRLINSGKPTEPKKM